MESPLRPLISVIAVFAALAVSTRVAAQTVELKPDGPTQEARAVKSAATYLQAATPSAISMGGTSKGPKSSRIHFRGKPAASRGPIPSYGRRQGLGLTIRICNYSRVPPRTLKEAERRAAAILIQSGVDTHWINCPTTAAEDDVYSDCRLPPAPEDLFVSILPAAMAEKSPSPSDALGLAYMAADGENSRYAGLFFDRIQEISRTIEVSPELVLGPVIAHEAGHLLLGSNSHSSQGIMQGLWDGDELLTMARCVVGFTDTQSRQLRRSVAERMRLDP